MVIILIIIIIIIIIVIVVVGTGWDDEGRRTNTSSETKRRRCIRWYSLTELLAERNRFVCRHSACRRRVALKRPVRRWLSSACWIAAHRRTSSIWNASDPGRFSSYLAFLLMYIDIDLLAYSIDWEIGTHLSGDVCRHPCNGESKQTGSFSQNSNRSKVRNDRQLGRTGGRCWRNWDSREGRSQRPCSHPSRWWTELYLNRSFH